MALQLLYPSDMCAIGINDQLSSKWDNYGARVARGVKRQ